VQEETQHLQQQLHPQLQAQLLLQQLLLAPQAHLLQQLLPVLLVALHQQLLQQRPQVEGEPALQLQPLLLLVCICPAPYCAWNLYCDIIDVRNAHEWLVQGASTFLWILLLYSTHCAGFLQTAMLLVLLLHCVCLKMFLDDAVDGLVQWSYRHLCCARK